MKQFSFTLQLPAGTPAEVAYSEGLARISHTSYADFMCHGGRRSKTPGVWIFRYTYTA